MPVKIEQTSITNANAAALLPVGSGAIAAGDCSFDLSAVAAVDTAAVALLLQWQREALARGGRLALTHAPSALGGLAKLYGVEALLGLDGEGAA